METYSLLDLLVRENRKYRRVFLRWNGPGPWKCYECGEPVVFETLCVHHLDGNDRNNDPKNLVATHRPCHQRLHYRQDGDRADMERMRAIRWGKPNAGEDYAKTMQERGYRVDCEHCGQPIVHWHMARHLRTHGADHVPHSE